MLTVNEAASRLGMSPRFVYRACATGQIASFKLGRCVRISESALKDYLEAQQKRVPHVETPQISRSRLKFLRLRRS